MSVVNVSLSGDKQLLAKLDRLSRKDSRSVVRKAARRAAKPILMQSRVNAPVDTGTLRRSIKIKAITRSRKRIGVKVTTGTAKSAYQGKQFYGAFQEYGTKKMAGKHFMKRAAESKSKEAVAIFADEAAKEITALARK